MSFLASIVSLLVSPLMFLAMSAKPIVVGNQPAEVAPAFYAALQRLPLSQEAQTEVAPSPTPIPPELPWRAWDVLPPEIDAKAAIIKGAKSGKVLYERNMRERVPIASLTKLATALVTVEELFLTDEVKISKHAVKTGGDFGNLVIGETLSVHDLLRAMLIASSNDAAVALSEHLTSIKGVPMTELMNAKAYALALSNTRFASVTGLEDAGNYSTAEDAAALLNAALAHSVIADVLSTASVDIHSTDGTFTHRLVTSNKLLGRFDGVVAGKTGYTEGAGGALALLAKNANADDNFLVVVLGSHNEETRFDAAKALIEWVNIAYRWK